jgi:F0F1-type ATP synthase membrane subunit b/b'
MNIVSLVMFGMAEDGKWWDYPGFELWRFVNLFIFVGAALLLHRRFGRPISEAFRQRRKRIQLELETAKSERDVAVAKLAEVEARLSKLDEELAKIRTEAAREAAAERNRIQEMTDRDIERMRDQARKEITSAGKTAEMELRRFAAAQSVRLAEVIIRQRLSSDEDARLIRASVEQIAGGRS